MNQKNIKGLRAGALNSENLSQEDKAKYLAGFRILNQTEHNIYALFGADQEDNGGMAILFEPVGYNVPRVKTESGLDDNGFQIMTRVKVVHLPGQIPNVIHLVSRETLRAVQKLYPSRTDFVCPGSQILDQNNKVAACRSLISKWD